MRKVKYVPCTPGGTYCFDIEANTEAQAWKNLEAALSHMPYPDLKAIKKRGYTVLKCNAKTNEFIEECA